MQAFILYLSFEYFLFCLPPACHPESLCGAGAKETKKGPDGSGGKITPLSRRGISMWPLYYCGEEERCPDPLHEGRAWVKEVKKTFMLR